MHTMSMYATKGDLMAALRAENERLRVRNAALVEIVRDSPCPSDGRYTVANCQQCGCTHGLLTRTDEQNK